MPSEPDKASENPYEAPRHPSDDNVNRQSGPWWARPGSPSILVALPIVVVLVIGVVVALLLPIIKWLR